MGEQGSKDSKSDWYGDNDEVSNGNKGKCRGKSKSETRYRYDCGEQGHIGVNCPYKRTNRIDAEGDQSSSWESELEGRKPEELASSATCARGAGTHGDGLNRGVFSVPQPQRHTHHTPHHRHHHRHHIHSHTQYNTQHHTETQRKNTEKEREEKTGNMAVKS